MTKYFKLHEFSCRCGCCKNNIDVGLVFLLNELRERVGIPLVITSGCRCEPYNTLVGGADSSSHVEGFAADIKALSSGTRYRIVEAAFDIKFARIGIAKTFIHLDIDFTKPQDVLWLY